MSKTKYGPRVLSKDAREVYGMLLADPDRHLVVNTARERDAIADLEVESVVELLGWTAKLSQSDCRSVYGLKQKK